MSLELWITFVVATLGLLALPGSVAMLLVSSTLGHGRSVAWAAIPGVVLGDCVAMTASVLGVGAILKTSATLFLTLKFAGAAYLVYLGIRIWRSDVSPMPIKAADGARSRTAVFKQAFLVTALNPKDIVFFVAFLPLFIDPGKSALLQVLIIEGTFLGLVVFTTALWITVGLGLRKLLTTPTALRRVNRFSGGCLVGVGALTTAST